MIATVFVMGQLRAFTPKSFKEGYGASGRGRWWKRCGLRLWKGVKVNENIITDGFGRRFPYLRLSLTDVCNFRCSYCLPDGYKKSGCEPFLSAEEIIRLVRAFAGLGVWKIRLTGGEPTVRPDFVAIAKSISEIPGIHRLALHDQWLPPAGTGAGLLRRRFACHQHQYRSLASGSVQKNHRP